MGVPLGIIQPRSALANATTDAWQNCARRCVARLLRGARPVERRRITDVEARPQAS
ncbi:hypothetical protein [Alloactinosynnema sp. L-07]|nr:hypothetical protein [Alloactinosynnema sp. L-07]